MFNLKQSREQLYSANQGMAGLKRVRYSPSRDVTGANFANGPMYIRFHVGGNKWWIPSKSFLRMRYTLRKGNNAVLTRDMYVAPAMGMMANLFQSLEFRINNNSICRISDYVGQVDALSKRLTKSGSWLNKTGGSTNYYAGEFLERSKIVTSDAYVDPEKSYYWPVTDAMAAAAPAAKGEAFTFLHMGTNTVQFYANPASACLRSAAGNAIPDLSDQFSIGQAIAFNDGAEKMRLITGFALQDQANDTILFAGANITGVGAQPLAQQIRTVDCWPQPSYGKGGHEVAWQPPLGIFKIGHAMPAGSYELVLNPHNVNIIQKLAIETAYGDLAQGVAATEIKFEVQDLYFEVCEVEGPRVDNITYLLDLPVINCQRRTISDTNALTQKEFTVSAATQALTVAFQDSRAGTITRNTSSKFRIGPSFAHNELALNRLFVNYAGVNKPQPDADPQVTALLDYTTERFIESNIDSGMYFKSDTETLKEWQERGPYYYFAWPRDDTSRDSRVFVNSSFSAAIDNASVLLFAHYRKTAMIKIESGLVTDVLVTDM